MSSIYGIFLQITGSPGLAILGLSTTLSILSYPLQKHGRRQEAKIREKIATIEIELAPYKGSLKGETLFKKTETIYEKYNYHPIQNMMLGMSFIMVLPILISAIIFLESHSSLNGTQFLISSDLSKPDQFLSEINLLPIVLAVITISDAALRFREDHKTFKQFLIITVLLFILVYNMSSALLIYWIANVVISAAFDLCQRRKTLKD